jgi:hypothetical protein
MDRTGITIPMLLFNCCLADRAENIIYLLLFAGRCTIAYLAVADKQRLYMLQYETYALIVQSDTDRPNILVGIIRNFCRRSHWNVHTVEPVYFFGYPWEERIFGRNSFILVLLICTYSNNLSLYSNSYESIFICLYSSRYFHVHLFVTNCKCFNTYCVAAVQLGPSLFFIDSPFRLQCPGLSSHIVL